jgi:hypothetical protein
MFVGDVGDHCLKQALHFLLPERNSFDVLSCENFPSSIFKNWLRLMILVALRVILFYSDGPFT